MVSSYSPTSGAEVSERKEEILGRHWQEFISEYPKKEDCNEAICRTINNDRPPQCRHCGGQNIDKTYGARYGNCRDCNKPTWFTAGTLFEGMKRPRAWWGTIWLKERGVSFNASDLAGLAGIAPSSALEILKKISIVLLDSMENESAAVAVSSALFAPTIYKRSLETPANEHPLAEQAEIERRSLTDAGGKSSATGELMVTAFESEYELSGSEKEVCRFLSTQPVYFNDLCEQTAMPVPKLSSILGMLEVSGLVKRMAGDCYTRSFETPKALNNGLTLQSSNGEDDTNGATIGIAAGIVFIRDCFRGISRKYLQLYLAAHWCHVDRGRWSSGSLLKACGRFRAIRYEEVRAYVSPLLVKLMPC